MRLPKRWTHAVLACAVVVVTLVVAAERAAGQEGKRGSEPPPDPTMECALRVRQFGIGAIVYAQKHGGKLPPDLYTTLTVVAESEGKIGAKAVGEYATTHVVSPAHDGLLRPPAEIDAPWVNEHSSYKYLGTSDVSMNDIQNWGDIVIAHLRLDQGHPVEVSPTNPEGQVFTLAFLDGHVMTTTRAEAEMIIAKSVATLEAIRTGGDAPPDQQAIISLAMVMKAIHAYAKAHDGTLPPDLGATLEYVPKDTKATTTAKQRGRIFLSPRAQKSGSAPDEPTPEWVNANTWYVYLGSPAVKLDDIPESHTLVLVHARLQDGFVEQGVDGKKRERVAVGHVGGRAALASKPYAEWLARESRKTLQALQTGEGMPDWVHAARDARGIADALREFTRKNEGLLPGDLSELAPLLPERMPGIVGPGAAARVFLSPRAELVTEIPDAVTREWVVTEGSYVYHGRPGDKTPEMISGSDLPLIHGKPEEAYRVIAYWSDEPVDVVPYVDAYGGCAMIPKEWLIQRLTDPANKTKLSR